MKKEFEHFLCCLSNGFMFLFKMSLIVLLVLFIIKILITVLGIKTFFFITTVLLLVMLCWLIGLLKTL